MTIQGTGYQPYGSGDTRTGADFGMGLDTTLRPNPPADPFPLPPNTGRKGGPSMMRAAGLAMIASLLLAGGVAAFVFGGDLDTFSQSDVEAAGQTPEPDPSLAPDLAGSAELVGAGWHSDLAPYVRFVEQTRGLEFSEPVELVRGDIPGMLGELNDEDAAAAAVAAAAEADDPEGLGYDSYEVAYQALGLSPQTLDLAESSDDVQQENAGAFYDAGTEAIYLPVDDGDPTQELSIVHELVHALQHQNGLLEFPDAESSGAHRLRLALIEGDASRIENLYYSVLSINAQLKIDAAYAQYQPAWEDSAYLADFLTTEFYLSYSMGEPLVESIVLTEGLGGLNELLRAEDLGTDERLLDPLTTTPYPKAYASYSIVDPDGNAWFDGWIGGFGWYYALAAQAGPVAALEAIDGYQDDAFVTWEDASGAICVRFEVRMDSSADGLEFMAALGGESDSLRIVRNSTVQLDRCGAIVAPQVDGFELLAPLVVSNWVLVDRLQAGVDPQLARCAAQTQAAELAAGWEAGEPGIGDGGVIDWDLVLADSAFFVAGCS